MPLSSSFTCFHHLLFFVFIFFIFLSFISFVYLSLSRWPLIPFSHPFIYSFDLFLPFLCVFLPFLHLFISPFLHVPESLPPCVPSFPPFLHVTQLFLLVNSSFLLSSIPCYSSLGLSTFSKCLINLPHCTSFSVFLPQAS